MKTNKELRQEAWQIVHTHWFGRLVIIGVLLNAITYLVALTLGGTFAAMNITTWTDLMQAKMQAMQEGLGYTLPTTEAYWRMAGASLFQTFANYVFGAIALFGVAGLTLKATKEQSERWFADSFGGFKRPFDVTWLLFVMNVRVFLWSLLFVIPGLVAAYRYRQAWYVKNENPDWSASRCLAESSRLMKGWKWRAFSFDASFWPWLLLAMGVMMISAICGVGGVATGSAITSLVSAFFGLLTTFAVAFALAYYFIGRAVFYRALRKEMENKI